MRIAATRFAWPPEDVDISASGGAEERARRDGIGQWQDVVEEKIEERVAGIRGSGDLHLGFGLNHTATSHLASVLTALAARS
jgi:hypothetical protein